MLWLVYDNAFLIWDFMSWKNEHFQHVSFGLRRSVRDSLMVLQEMAASKVCFARTSPRECGHFPIKAERDHKVYCPCGGVKSQRVFSAVLSHLPLSILDGCRSGLTLQDFPNELTGHQNCNPKTNDLARSAVRKALRRRKGKGIFFLTCQLLP